jgi:antitoxin component YwqK of YwqJK toxin-antitoxin module
MLADLNIAEIFYASGAVQFRYGRYLADDGSKWIRHGQFEAYHENGVLASSGQYADGFEHGTWRDFHENGQPAAEGRYENGVEVGAWTYWNADGQIER